jgi:hypothetical protein
VRDARDREQVEVATANYVCIHAVMRRLRRAGLGHSGRVREALRAGGEVG